MFKKSLIYHIFKRRYIHFSSVLYLKHRGFCALYTRRSGLAVRFYGEAFKEQRSHLKDTGFPPSIARCAKALMCYSQIPEITIDACQI